MNKDDIWKFSKYFITSAFGNAASTVLLAIGSGFVSGYKFDYKNIQNLWDILWILFNPYICIILGTIILLVTSYRLYKDQEKFSSLEEKNRSLEKDKEHLEDKNKSLIKEKEELQKDLNVTQEECRKLELDIFFARQKQVEDWLKGLFKQFTLTTKDRISIFCVVDNTFHIVHRYSDNPSLCNKTKHQYILKRGVIYEAWCHNRYHEFECPVYENGPAEYVNYISNKYGYEKDEVNSLNMKSCRYFGLSIKETGKNIGVIIFESISNENLGNEIIASIEDYCKSYQDYLCGFIKEYISDINKDNIKRHALSNSNNDKEVINELRGD